MITVEIKNIKEIQAACLKYPGESIKIFNKAINKSLIAVQKSAMQNAPRFNSNLAAHWDLQMGQLKGSLSPTEPYAIFVENGTAPHFPPIAAITPWAERYGINPWALQKSIGKKGTKAHPFFAPAIDENRTTIDKYFKDALDSLPKIFPQKI